MGEGGQGGGGPVRDGGGWAGWRGTSKGWGRVGRVEGDQ